MKTNVITVFKKKCNVLINRITENSNLSSQSLEYVHVLRKEIKLYSNVQKRSFNGGAKQVLYNAIKSKPEIEYFDRFDLEDLTGYSDTHCLRLANELVEEGILEAKLLRVQEKRGYPKKLFKLIKCQ